MNKKLISMVCGLLILFAVGCETSGRATYLFDAGNANSLKEFFELEPEKLLQVHVADADFVTEVISMSGLLGALEQELAEDMGNILDSEKGSNLAIVWHAADEGSNLAFEILKSHVTPGLQQPGLGQVFFVLVKTDSTHRFVLIYGDTSDSIVSAAQWLTDMIVSNGGNLLLDPFDNEVVVYQADGGSGTVTCSGTPDDCFIAPVQGETPPSISIERQLPQSFTPGYFTPGEPVVVRILFDINDDGDIPNNLNIVDVFPAGWTATNPTGRFSDVNAGQHKVSMILEFGRDYQVNDNAGIAASGVAEYTLTPSVDATGTASFSGKLIYVVDENGNSDVSDESEHATEITCGEEADGRTPNVCLDGFDNNCDGSVDIDDAGCTACKDADGDGYGLDGGSNCDTPGQQDCDDALDNVNPGEIEDVGNDVDENCDGVAEPADSDGDGAADGDDCAPTDSSIFPGQVETCGNGIDENCDGVADEDCEEPIPDHSVSVHLGETRGRNLNAKKTVLLIGKTGSPDSAPASSLAGLERVQHVGRVTESTEAHLCDVINSLDPDADRVEVVGGACSNGAAGFFRGDFAMVNGEGSSDCHTSVNAGEGFIRAGVKTMCGRQIKYLTFEGGTYTDTRGTVFAALISARLDNDQRGNPVIKRDFIEPLLRSRAGVRVTRAPGALRVNGPEDLVVEPIV